MILEGQHPRFGKQHVQRSCSRKACLLWLQARVAGTQWRGGAGVVRTDLPELRTLVQGGALPHLGMGTSGGLGAEGHTQFVCHVGTKLGEGEEQKADEVVTPVIP